MKRKSCMIESDTIIEVPTLSATNRSRSINLKYENGAINKK